MIVMLVVITLVGMGNIALLKPLGSVVGVMVGTWLSREAGGRDANTVR